MRENLIDLALNDERAIFSHRPDVISVTLIANAGLQLGLRLTEDHSVASLDESERTTTSTAHSRVVATIESFPAESALRVISETNILQPGDILESINGSSLPVVTNDVLTEFLNTLEGVVTLGFRTNGLDQPPLHCVAVFIKNNTDEENKLPEGNRRPQGDKDEVLLSDFELDKSERGFLRIKKITSTSASDIAVNQGDLVIGISDSPCLTIDPEDAALLWQVKSETMNVVSIATLAASKRSWRQRLKRASVTIGGGALVGVGAVIMATPLHPVGHAMAIGGVGVLGMEYEGPRKLVNRFRSQKSGNEDSIDGDTDHERKSIEADGEGSGHEEGSQPPKEEPPTRPAVVWLQKRREQWQQNREKNNTETNPPKPQRQRWLSRWRQQEDTQESGDTKLQTSLNAPKPEGSTEDEGAQ